MSDVLFENKAVAHWVHGLILTAQQQGNPCPGRDTAFESIKSHQQQRWRHPGGSSITADSDVCGGVFYSLSCNKSGRLEHIVEDHFFICVFVITAIVMGDFFAGIDVA